MKKLLVFISIVFFISGCSKDDSTNIIKKYNDDINSLDSYSLKANMSIKTDEEEFKYLVNVKYLNKDLYAVELINKGNDHKQIILKNNDGVYVITPSINKSFKFQSSWPDNSSQSYLLKSLLKDINVTKKIKSTNDNKYTIIRTDVNYPNNIDLKYQDIYFGKDNKVKKVIVYDNDGNEKIYVEFTSVKYNANIDKNEFELDNYIKESEITNNCDNEPCEKTKNTSNILEDIVYPLYLPGNTYLTSSEKIDNENNRRVILTFSGEKDFTIVEETLNIPDTFEVTPVFGDPIMLNDTLGVISDNSIKWNSGNISYYLTSNSLNNNEMREVASSMNSLKSVMGSK